MELSELPYELIKAERVEQELHRTSGRFLYTPASADCPEIAKAAMIQEEFGEVCRNVLARAGLVTDGDTSDAALTEELVQVAALSVAWIESLL